MQNCHKTYNEMLLVSNTPLEHLFDNHEFCGAWCKRKRELVQLTNGKTLHEDRQTVYYRCKENDAALYALVKNADATFQCKEVLMQSMHTYFTQLNEWMNLAIAKYAPKRKMFSWSMLLWNCVSIVIGVQNMGHHYI
eukprot:1532318-Ditylum_brightwellii.AAC.1